MPGVLQHPPLGALSSLAHSGWPLLPALLAPQHVRACLSLDTRLYAAQQVGCCLVQLLNSLRTHLASARPLARLRGPHAGASFYFF